MPPGLRRVERLVRRESLPDVLSRMQPRSYFADPKWVGENFPFPKDPNQPTGPNAKSRSKKAER